MSRGTRIGLEIATTCVRAAEVRLSGDVPRLEKIGQIGLPEGAVVDGQVNDLDAVGDAIAELWRTVKFSSKFVTLGVANARVVVRLLDIPWIAPPDLRASLPLVIGDAVPMPAESTVMDMVPLEERQVDGKRMLHGLLVAADENMLMNAVEAARAGGLRPQAIDLSSFAMIRSLYHPSGLGMNRSVEAIVDVGARVSSVVVHVNGRPQFVRILTMGGNDVTTRLMEVFGITLVQAEEMKREHPMIEPTGAVSSRSLPGEVIGDVLNDLLDEIRSSLEYYLGTSGATRIERITLSGGVARTRGFASRLIAVTGVQVAYALPLAAMEIGSTGLAPEQLAFLEPMAAVPVGLAMVAA